MRGIVRLDDNFPAVPMAAGAPRCLRNQHEAALRGAKVRHIEARIRADDTDSRDVRDIVPFGDHLRT